MLIHEIEEGCGWMRHLGTLLVLADLGTAHGSCSGCGHLQMHRVVHEREHSGHGVSVVQVGDGTWSMLRLSLSWYLLSLHLRRLSTSHRSVQVVQVSGWNIGKARVHLGGVVEHGFRKLGAML